MYPGVKDSVPLVRCTKHSHEYITNYDCILLEPICPECLDEHLKRNQQNGIQPEVDTLKKVRTMCSQKASSLADSLEKELSKLGISLNSSPGSMFASLNNDLDDVRRKLHKFIDDYLDTVRNDLQSKLRGEDGNIGSLGKVLGEIKQMIADLRISEKQLFSKLE